MYFYIASAARSKPRRKYLIDWLSSFVCSLLLRFMCCMFVGFVIVVFNYGLCIVVYVFIIVAVMGY